MHAICSKKKKIKVWRFKLILIGKTFPLNGTKQFENGL